MNTNALRENKKKPLIVKGKNAKGEVVEAMILSGKRSKKDPTLEIAEILMPLKGIRPSPLPKQ